MFCSSSVYPSKPIRPIKPVCLSKVHQSKPTISSNFYLSKLVCPRNVSFSRSIRSSDVCQSRSNVIPSKPIRPGNACLGKAARPSKFYPSKPYSPSNICPNVLILRQNLRLLLPEPTMVCLLLFFWLLGLSITGPIIKIVFALILEIIFITFIIYFILKLYIFINVFLQKLAIFLGMACIYSLGFYRYLCFTVLCFLSLYC